MRQLFWAVAACTLLFGSARAADPARPVAWDYIPADCAFVLHIDVAALVDGTIGESLKASKSKFIQEAFENAVPGVGKLEDIKTYTTIVPQANTPTDFIKSGAVITFRKDYDRKAFEKYFADQAKTFGLTVKTDGDFLRATTKQENPRFISSMVADLSAKDRVVMAIDQPDEFFKGGVKDQGSHSAVLKANAGAAFIALANINALPDAIRDEQNIRFLPEPLKPFASLASADTASLIGTLGKAKLDFKLTVKSKTKDNATNVTAALNGGKDLMLEMLPVLKKETDKDEESAKAMGKLLDAATAMFKGAEVKTSDSTSTAAMSISLDLPYAEVLARMAIASERMQLSNNMKQIGLAMHNYNSAYQVFPSAATVTDDKKPKKLHSWRVHILPFIEQEQLYKQFKLDEPWDSEHNLKVFKDNPMPKVYGVPGVTKDKDKTTHFQVFVGNGAFFDEVGGTAINGIVDGTSNTIMIALAEKAVEWTKPDDIEFEPNGDVVKKLLWLKGGVTTLTFADGSVRTIKKTVDEKALKAFITRAGGEVANLDD